MGYIESILLGVIQGLTEFLPVSSSGHLALFEKLFGTASGNLIFEVGVHFGTVLSILFVYRKTIIKLFKEIINFLQTRQLNMGVRSLLLIVVSSMPAGIIGILFKSYFESAFTNLLIVGSCFIITGALLFWTEKKVTQKNGLKSETDFDMTNNLETMREISFGNALIIGWAQAFAIMPGISRSGSTIAIALSLGISRNAAAMFSFLMSIPVILGASLLQILSIEQMTNSELKYLLISVSVSFLFGLIGLYLILHFVKKARLSRFSWYLWALGVLSISYHFYGG